MMNNAQQHINQMQSVYKEWLDLQTKLAQAQTDLQKSVQLMKILEDFYFDGKWREIYETIENGESLDLTTAGEYSVMGEDTLWNAFNEQQALLWQFLRFAVKHLDKGEPDFDEEM